MKDNNKLLKKGYKLSLVSLFLCLFASLFLFLPIYWITSLVVAISKSVGKEATKALLMTICLITFTLLKTCFSITGIVFGFKIRKKLKINNNYFTQNKLILLLAIFNILSVLTIILSLCFGLIVKYLVLIDIITCILLTISAILLIFDYKRRKKLVNEEIKN